MIRLFAAMAEPDFESEQQPAVVAAPPALREPPAIRRTSSMDNPGATSSIFRFPESHLSVAPPCMMIVMLMILWV